MWFFLFGLLAIGVYLFGHDEVRGNNRVLFIGIVLIVAGIYNYMPR